MCSNNENNIIWCNANSQIIIGDNSHLKYIDPLQGIAGNEVNHEYYQMSNITFAEPLPIVNSEVDNKEDDTGNPQIETDELTIIENVVIRKMRGKQYKKYQMNIEDTSSLSCPQSKCNKSFKTRKLLKAHIRKVHCADKNRYICDVCGSMFACHYLLVRHSRVHSGEKVKCDICNIPLSGRTSLSAHLRTHSGIKSHTCTICNKEFARKSTLNTHVKFVHRTKELLCVSCNQRFDSRSQFANHTSEHRKKVNGATN